jgi:hypothetical protein
MQASRTANSELFSEFITARSISISGGSMHEYLSGPSVVVLPDIQ